MNNICTSVEQSKKLIEFGIDVSTADMVYLRVYLGEERDYILLIDSYPEEYTENGDGSLIPVYDEHIPAWSLSALLKLIKSEIYGETIYGDTITYKVDFRKYKFTDDVDLYQIAYGSIKFDEDGHDSFKDMINTGQKEDPIDAAFEMVVWLKENGKI